MSDETVPPASPATADVVVATWVDKGLRDYVKARYYQLYGEYRALAFPRDDPDARRLAEHVIEQSREGIGFEELYNFEKALLKLWPPERLKRAAWEIRSQYRDLAGSSQYDLYQKSAPPDPEKACETDLRVDLMQIQDEIHRLLVLLPAQSRARNSIVDFTTTVLTRLVWLFLVLIGINFVLGYFSEPKDSRASPQEFGLHVVGSVFLLTMVAFFGAVGGAMSSFRRLQSASTDGNPLVVLFGLIYGKTSVLLSPLAGAVFAVVFCMILAGGFIKGAIFPEFEQGKRSMRAAAASQSDSKKTGQQTTGAPAANGQSSEKPDQSDSAPPTGAVTKLSPSDFLFAVRPLQAIDYAKLIVWSFLAGFAEQLVPDTLDRLKTRAKSSENTKSVNTQNP